MIADSNQEQIGGGNGNGDMEAKGFGSFYFDEDEE